MYVSVSTDPKHIYFAVSLWTNLFALHPLCVTLSEATYALTSRTMSGNWKYWGISTSDADRICTSPPHFSSPVQHNSPGVVVIYASPDFVCVNNSSEIAMVSMSRWLLLHRFKHVGLWHQTLETGCDLFFFVFKLFEVSSKEEGRLCDAFFFCSELLWNLKLQLKIYFGERHGGNRTLHDICSSNELLR